MKQADIPKAPSKKKKKKKHFHRFRILVRLLLRARDDENARCPDRRRPEILMPMIAGRDQFAAI